MTEKTSRPASPPVTRRVLRPADEQRAATPPIIRPR